MRQPMMPIAMLRCLAVATALSLTAYAADAKSYLNGHLLIDADTLSHILARTGGDAMVVLDVRSAEAFHAGHIPGAVRIDPNAVSDPAAPVNGALRPIEEIAVILGHLGIAADTEVVVYDDRGGFHAARMFWLLEYLGHRRVKLLNGGLPAWQRQGLPVAEGRGDKVMARRFVPVATGRRWADADYIMAHRSDEGTRVVDVRPTALFEKGHIPWALSVPWADNLTADGMMKDAATLAAHFADHGITPDLNVVIHCQNGLASSHSYVALRLLGYPRVRTYHRSWADWGTTDDLPKAVARAG